MGDDALSEEPVYVNDGPDGERCEYVYEREHLNRGRRCGLRVWEDAPEEDPRCEFHSRESPDDIKERLEKAVRERRNLRARCRLRGTVRTGCATWRGTYRSGWLTSTRRTIIAMVLLQVGTSTASNAVRGRVLRRHGAIPPVPEAARPGCLAGAASPTPPTTSACRIAAATPRWALTSAAAVVRR